MADQDGTPDTAPEAVMESPLVDLSSLDLTDVAELPDTVLGTALRAVMDAARHPDAVFTAEYQEKLSRS
jgi:FXSXX-COOH protein